MIERTENIPIKAGLTPETFRRLNTPTLSLAKNVIARQDHIEPLPALNQLGAIAPSWPFPQVYRSTYGILSFSASSVSLLDGAWSPTLLAFRDPADKDGAPLVIATNDDPWHFADFHGSWMAVNKETLLWTTALAEYNSDGAGLFGTTGLSINSIANFRGIAVMGGFIPSEIWGTSFTAMFEGWLNYQETPEAWEKDYTDIDSNWVMWSSIGGGDFPQWLRYPAGFGYDLSPSADEFLDRALRNEFGWIPMSWRGDVLRVLPLDKALLVYGAQGVTALIFDQGAQFSVTGPTFGVRDLLMEGIPGRMCAAGDDNVHVFISNDKELWLVGGDLRLQRLGYKQHLSRLTMADVVISQDPLRRDFWISDGDTTFVLGAGGLTESEVHPTSLFRLSGSLYGPHSINSTYRVTSADETRVTSDGDIRGAGTGDLWIQYATAAFDFNYRGMKTITQVQLPVWNWLNTQVMVETTYDGYTYSQLPWMPVGPEGVAFIRAAGVSFRIHVRHKTSEAPDISYLVVSYQRSDKRFVRGPDASSINAGTGIQ